MEAGTITIMWLVLLAVLLGIEIATMGLTTIWFAGGALIAFLLSLFQAPLWSQIAVFIVASIVLLIFTRPIALKYMNKGVEKTNVDSLIGETAVVTADIHNLEGRGQVFVNGLTWTARAEREEETIPKDTQVEIVRVEGVKLIVKKKEEG